ncbi:AAA family ATPase [Kineococcus rhizosphaerae]|uniref:NadR type nicotinamide-nucleotide adenylyltransferase n=1 Tax=Kineococcus rhizosphaerae TaxID=559628 RepID=A0A2T0R8R0_9ACTN|nr:AAA family ATPase [Kineococcus rhizosphaerae]PRY17561.1 NadR type nicotinamide-nucleotide adenylyltransferase [Kineococcus rhizosphaerae]
MSTGLVVGKFYPPHPGHHALVETAASRCDDLVVLVEAADRETVPLADRVAWMQAEHPGVRVLGARCDAPVDYASDVVWAAQVRVMQVALELGGVERVDVVFSSETYGAELARRLGAVHDLVDLERTRVPLSATLVRADPLTRFGALRPSVRAGLAVRAVFVGAESTGTTTVSRLVADRLRARAGAHGATRWVPEHGRDHSVELVERGGPGTRMEDVVWTPDDFATIAARQNALEEEAARAGGPVLVCDTDSLATTVWECRYLGGTSAGTRAEAGRRAPRRTYFVTDHVGVPFEQDGYRDGEHVREAMTDWFLHALTAAGESWVFLTGPVASRVELALRVIDRQVGDRFTFGRPLG